MKKCPKCGRPEGEVEFSLHRRQCKECRKAYQRDYYADNKGYFKDPQSLQLQGPGMHSWEPCQMLK